MSVRRVPPSHPTYQGHLRLYRNSELGQHFPSLSVIKSWVNFRGQNAVLYQVPPDYMSAPTVLKVISFANAQSETVDRSAFDTELSVLSKISHPNIVKLYRSYEMIHDQCGALLMELLSGSDLLEYIQVSSSVISEYHAASMFAQLLDAVAYLHQHNIIHRDIKPENVVRVSADRTTIVKLIDFSVSKIYDPSNPTSGDSGTRGYASPETILGFHETPKVDIWSLGVLLFCMLTGHAPFGSSDEDYIQIIDSGYVNLEHNVFHALSGEAQEIVRAMLQVIPERRPSAEELRNFPWVVNRCETTTERLLR